MRNTEEESRPKLSEGEGLSSQRISQTGGREEWDMEERSLETRGGLSHLLRMQS